MKAFPTAMLALFALAACNRQQEQSAQPDVQAGIDRSVADVRAAEAASAAPAAESRSVGELTRKAGAGKRSAREQDG